MALHRLKDRNWTVILLLYLCLIYPPFIISKTTSPESFMKGDSYYYRAIIISIVQDKDLLLANNVPTDPLNGELAIGKEGLVPKHPILMPLVSIPFYLLLATPGLLLFNILDCLILIVLIFKLNCLFYNRLIAFVTAILYATGTLFLDYAYNYSPDIFSTVLLLGGLYFVLCEGFYVGAALLGLSVFAKIPNAPVVGVILLYAGFVILKGKTTNGSLKENLRGRLGVAITTMVIFLIAIAPFAYTNYMLFGSPFVTGYQRTAVAGANGQLSSVNHTNMFDQPLLKGIDLSLFDPRNGIILTDPVLILAFVGVFLIRKIKPHAKTYLILLICLIQFILFAKYDEWYMSDFGNRFLMTFIALSSVFTGNFLSHLSTKFSLEDPQKQFL